MSQSRISHAAPALLALASLPALLFTVEGCGGSTSHNTDDLTLYASYTSGPGGFPLALLQGTTATSIPVLSGRPANAVTAIRLGSGAQPRLLAPIDGTPGSLAIVQTGTNAIVANINVGDNPTAVAVNDDASRAYVTNFGSNSVSVIDLGSNTVAAAVSLPSGAKPFRVDVSVDGDAYVVSRDASTVWVIDGSTNTIQSTIPVPASPHDIIVHPNGSQAYVSQPLANSITVIDTLSATVAGSISAVQTPMGLATGSNVGANFAAGSGNGPASAYLVDFSLQTAGSAQGTNSLGAWRVAMSPNGTQVAYAGVGNEVTIVDVGLGNSAKNTAGTRTSGLSYTRVVTQTPPTQTVTTIPSGLRVRVDNTDFTAPASFNWAPGSQHTITVASPQTPSTGARHTWQAWSNGGALSQTVTAPAGSITYTANFKTQYLLTTGTTPPFTGGIAVVRSPNTSDAYYDAGSTVGVQATAAANTGLVFAEWQGDLTGDDNPDTLVMSGPKQVTAIFDNVPLWGVNIGNRGAQNGGAYFHTTFLKNARNEAYTDLKITGIQWAVEAGTGAISNTTSIPVSLGAVTANGQTGNIAITANIPASITRWTFTLTGTVKNAAGRSLSWTATSAPVIR
ncbi:MAG: YncE family protein [Bryobacteraceae bacterium]